jgi:hypothetical protein
MMMKSAVQASSIPRINNAAFQGYHDKLFDSKWHVIE